MNTQAAKVSHETKSSDSKDKKAIERKWNRITSNISKIVTNIEEAANKPEECDIEVLSILEIKFLNVKNPLIVLQVKLTHLYQN